MTDSLETFNIELGFFSGPMDLLLHLVHEKQVPVEDVDMLSVAQQYLDIISKAKLVDLERASEYLVIAATLLAFKSDILVKSHSPESLDGLIDDRSQDPNFLEELRERLRQYEIIKRQSFKLSELPQLGADTFTRRYRPNREELRVKYEVEADPHRLADIFGRLLKRVGGYIGGFRIARSDIAVVELMVSVIEKISRATAQGVAAMGFSMLVAEDLKLKLRRTFGLVNKSGDPTALTQRNQGDITRVIGYFLAVLELVKRGVIGAVQVNPEDEISLSEAKPVTAEDLESSEFDLNEAA